MATIHRRRWSVSGNFGQRPVINSRQACYIRIYPLPAKTADFHGYPIYDDGRIVCNQIKTPLYVPATQEEYPADCGRNSKYTPPAHQLSGYARKKTRNCSKQIKAAENSNQMVELKK